VNAFAQVFGPVFVPLQTNTELFTYSCSFRFTHLPPATAAVAAFAEVLIAPINENAKAHETVTPNIFFEKVTKFAMLMHLLFEAPSASLEIATHLRDPRGLRKANYPL
jgi:hypothetical protein